METKQGDRQVVGHALLVVGEQDVAAGGEIGLLHQLLQVLDRFAAEADEVAIALQVLTEPAAERVGPGLALEEAPGLVLGVVAFVEVGQRVIRRYTEARRRITASGYAPYATPTLGVGRITPPALSADTPKPDGG